MTIWQEMKKDWERLKAGGPLITQGRILAFVMLLVFLCALRMLPMAFPLFGISPRACCSCVCKKKNGDFCPGSKQRSYFASDCQKVCRAACRRKGCGLKEFDPLPVNQCEKMMAF